jgi:2-desacetyl-2-hydroxyethyl bacteriochlorophyllide A dehydrogenase
MIKTMKAAFLIKPGEIRIKKIPIPDPEPGWVRLKNKACGVCGTDMHYYKGKYPELRPDDAMKGIAFHKIYGHEVSGVIDKIGLGVKGLKIGDAVAVIAPIYCKKCKYCRSGMNNLCENLKVIGFDYPGGFAEYMTVPAENIYQLPSIMSFEEGSILDVLVIGIHAVHLANVTMADRVVVLGAGPIGLALLAAAKRAGAREVFITAKYQSQKEVVKKMGVEHIFDPNDRNLLNKITKTANNDGVDCVLESVGGNGESVELALKVVRKGGRIIFTGFFEERVSINFYDLLAKGVTIIGSGTAGFWNLTSELELAVDMLVKKEFPVKDIITHRFPIEEINKAFQQKLKLEEKDKTIKVEIFF